MNKKFTTLLASFLLAGGLFTAVNAETIADAAAMAKGQLFFVKVDDKSATDATGAGTFTNCLNSSEANYLSTFDATSTELSAMWSVEKISEKVNGVETVIGYKLINAATGKALQATDDKGTVYDTFTGVEQLLFTGKTGWGFDTVDKDYLDKASPLYSDLVAVSNLAQTADQLNDFNGTSFDLNICYQPLKSNGAIDGDKAPVSYDAKGNVFAETMKAEDEDKDGNVELYQVGSKKRVVLLTEKWGNITNSLETAGYKFAVLNEKEYAAAVTDKKILADEFIITKPATVTGEPLEVVAVDATDTKYELVVSGVDGVYYVTTNADTNTGVADYTANGTTNPNNTYVIFGKGNFVDNDIFIGKIWEIYKNDKIASPDCSAEFVSKSQVATGYPEGQWLWNDETEEFINRESGKALAYPGLRFIEGKEGVYANGDDTYTITAVGTPGESEEGYLHGYSNDVLKQKAFFIGAPVDATKDTIYLSRGTNGVLKFSADKSDAAEFRMTPKTLGDDHQSVQIRNAYTAWKDEKAGTKEEKTDIVSFTQYVVTEAVTGEELYYDAKEERYVLATEKVATDNGYTAAPELLFKNKKADTYNILFFSEKDNFGKEKDDKYHYINSGVFCNEASKLLSAFNTSELVKEKEAYALVQNDLFVIVDADAQQYRGDFSNTGVLDTIKIFRNDDNSYVLYEKGELLKVNDVVKEGFLGMENFFDPQYAGKQPALLADTAFHANTYRPQYMLAVDATIEADGMTCPYDQKHNDPEWRKENGGPCPHAVADRPYIAGRYLVNLVDSAKACENKVNNKFTYELYETARPYYRLGFVQAKHIGDSLIIASTNDTIDLAANRPDYDKTCTFAFKYVDDTRDAFTIETVYNYGLDKDGDFDTKQYERGYIKYHNGIPVVTPKASEAWVFDLEVLEGQIPTANEGINASEVSVIATEGAVIINGAQGKKVTISNVLGQTVANTVVSSDKAEIAAPAGVVVVAVEGEAAVKAIVK